jgi:hypothetical protein
MQAYTAREKSSIAAGAVVALVMTGMLLVIALALLPAG